MRNKRYNRRATITPISFYMGRKGESVAEVREAYRGLRAPALLSGRVCHRCRTIRPSVKVRTAWGLVVMIHDECIDPSDTVIDWNNDPKGAA